MVSVSSQLANRTLLSGTATDDRHKLFHVILVVSHFSLSQQKLYCCSIFSSVYSTVFKNGSQ